MFEAEVRLMRLIAGPNGLARYIHHGYPSTRYVLHSYFSALTPAVKVTASHQHMQLKQLQFNRPQSVEIGLVSVES